MALQLLPAFLLFSLLILRQPMKLLLLDPSLDGPDAHKALLDLAREARHHAYAPYSRFAVGAALWCENGQVVLGANVENGSFGATCCAERVALFTAVAAGHRQFRAIAVIGGLRPTPPCGMCRQVLVEFVPSGSPFSVILEGADGTPQTWPLDALVPLRFDGPPPEGGGIQG